MCYKAKLADAPKHVPVEGQIHTANEFGSEQLDTIKEQELCVSATRNWEVIVRDSFSALASGGIPADSARGVSHYRHPLQALFSELDFEPTPFGNRGTYEQIVDVSPEVKGEFMFPLGQSGLAARELGAARGELTLRAGEGLLGLLERREALLDVEEALFRCLGGCRGAASEVGFHPQQRPLARLDLTFAPIQLVSMRGEADLRVLERPSVEVGNSPGVAPHAGDCVCELALPLLDRGDPFRQLRSQASELLLGSNSYREQALLLALDGDGLVLRLAEKGHASMICAGRANSCFEPRLRARDALRRGRGGRSPPALRSEGVPSRLEATARAAAGVRPVP